MAEYTDQELHQIIHRVLRRTLGTMQSGVGTASAISKDTTESKPVQASPVVEYSAKTIRACPKRRSQ